MPNARAVSIRIPNMHIAAQPLWRDYLELCKPRVVLLMLLCAAVGMYSSKRLALLPGRPSYSGCWVLGW